MYVVEINGQTVDVGTIITIDVGMDTLEFEVKSIDVAKESFNIAWVGDNNKGQRDILPFSVFGKDAVNIIEITGDDPNSVFARRKRANV